MSSLINEMGLLNKNLNSIPSDLKTCNRLNSFGTSLRKYYESKLPSYSPPGCN